MNKIFKSLMDNFLRKYKGLLGDFVEIKFAMAYLKAIKSLRFIFLDFLLLGLSLVLIGIGLLLIPTSVVTYAPWGWQTKMTILIIAAAVFILFGAILMKVLISEKRWAKSSRLTDLVEKVLKE